MSPWVVWLIVAALFVVFELLTGTFALFCLVGGCLIALVAALLGCGLVTQIAFAALGALLSFIALRPLIRKHWKHDSISTGCNMDALIGREANLSEAIEASSPGRLRIDGDNWQARTADGSTIAQGERVRIIGYDSIILIVERV